MNAAAPAVTLRAAEPTEAEFLYRVYASTRQEELAVTGWTAAAIEAFLREQFRFQDLHYRTHHPTTAFDLILAGDEPIGRLYVERTEATMHILDIALLPEWRGRGIGSGLLDALLAEARGAGQVVQLFVETGNPARRLYTRLGFVQVDETGPYVELHLAPPPA